MNAAAPDAGARLSDDLLRLVTASGERPVTLREVIAVTEGRVYTLPLVLLALPFCTPIPLPGFSTVFGLVIVLFALRLTLGQRPWLPARLLDRPLPRGIFPLILRSARRMVRLLESVLRPRLTYLFDRQVTRCVCGLAIVASVVLLLLPLSIPFSNFLPALSVILIAVSLTERDGVMLLAGFGLFAITAAFFATIFLGGAAVVRWLEERFDGILVPDYETPPAPPTDGVPAQDRVEAGP